jgi:hypothetical protein
LSFVFTRKYTCKPQPYSLFTVHVFIEKKNQLVQNNADFGYALPRNVALVFSQNEKDTLAARSALACLFYNHLTCSKTASSSSTYSNRGGEEEEEASATGSGTLAACACRPSNVNTWEESHLPGSIRHTSEEGNDNDDDMSYFLESLAAQSTADRAVAARLHAWSDAAWLQSESIEVTTI